MANHIDERSAKYLNLQEWFGQIDIYLFDQLLKGRITPRMRVLDAGCGGGRNLIYFLRSGYDVCGVDQSREAIAQVRSIASTLATQLPGDNFRVEPVERMSFADESFDVVISSAVLHFAKDEEQWQMMVAGDVESVKAGWDFLCPAGRQHRNRRENRAYRRKALSSPGRKRSVPCR